jgi:hypothetical protein
MNATASMQTRYPSLTKEDCAVMLVNLDRSLAVFEGKNTVLSVSEIRVKSLLAAVRHELLHHHVQLADDGQ